MGSIRSWSFAAASTTILVADSAVATTDGISTCGETWMAVNDVTIGDGTDHRSGFNSAVDRFCSSSDVDGATVKEDGYLSMATETFLSGGKDPSTYGLLGFLKSTTRRARITKLTVGSSHLPERAKYSLSPATKCKNYLKTLSSEGKCYGDTNKDTKGGTYQVGDNEVSYHALANIIPPTQDALNKAFTEGALSTQTVNLGGGPELDPWPFDSLDDVLPVAVHSHNDYTNQQIPVFQALSAGCVSIEADVWLVDGDVSIGHKEPAVGRTLGKQYVEPLKAILDHNGGSVYKANTTQGFSLLVDFKSKDDETLDAVVKALDPLRQADYLSKVVDGKFQEKQVTVVASGDAPFDRISKFDGIPGKDVFYDAKLTDLDKEDYNTLNSYWASAQFGKAARGDVENQRLSGDQTGKIEAQVKAAHDKGLKVRYWDLPGDYIWEQLSALGVDRLNADDMSATARLPRIS
ncbi:Uu.00g056530.m01.CDS01 [Anthostomella pinea]|uniref:Altered inheritance of mitochondria protein 6 n=1 Tax=Anthostomella pinea TaxID=933095 RepID=A0AAI8YLY8_9PEZI|nr:Uu.00g056530.m01.CDS01 [Anthostomella pinea]